MNSESGSDHNTWDTTLAVEVVAALLGVEGIQVNQKTPEGWTALVGAADKGHHSVVKKLLQHPNIDPNVRDKQGRQSCRSHFIKLVSFL